ncbi:MAG: hypothetical protein ACI8YI_002810, partial [Paracoccaceae bacterium]
MKILTTHKNDSSIAFEFVIGVTGHRDNLSSDATELKAQIAKVVTDIQARFANLPVRVVTGLAEGTDMLATQVALDLGMQVTAVLPMPRAAYEEDFEGSALAEFKKLADDSRVQVVELPVANDGKLSSLKKPSARIAQYAQLKDYLVRRSNILLALWDGKMIEGKGGTSDVLSGYLSGHAKHVTPARVTDRTMGFVDCGDLAIWIPTPRRSDPEATAKSEPKCLISDSSGMTFIERDFIPDQFVDRWSGFDAYAKDRHSDKAAQIDAYPLAMEGDSSISADARAIDAEFIRADQLAMANQQFSDLLFKGFGLIAGGMGLFFLIYAKLAAMKIYLVIYIALFLAGYILFKIGGKKHWFGHHLAYRALAETMRVQFFLLISGAGKDFSTRRVLSITSVDRFKRFEWLQDAVRCTEPLTYDGHASDESRLAQVSERWIDDQAGYFSRKLKSLHTQHGRLEIIKAGLLLGSVAGALALIFFKKTLLHLDMIGYDGKAWLVFMMGLLPLWLAVWELYQGKMATRELLWQYANQRRYFAAAKQ